MHTLSLCIQADQVHYANTNHIKVQLDSLLIAEVPLVVLVHNLALTIDHSVAWNNASILRIRKLHIRGKLCLQGTRES